MKKIYRCSKQILNKIDDQLYKMFPLVIDEHTFKRLKIRKDVVTTALFF